MVSYNGNCIRIESLSYVAVACRNGEFGVMELVMVPESELEIQGLRDAVFNFLDDSFKFFRTWESGDLKIKEDGKIEYEFGPNGEIKGVGYEKIVFGDGKLRIENGECAIYAKPVSWGPPTVYSIVKTFKFYEEITAEEQESLIRRLLLKNKVLITGDLVRWDVRDKTLVVERVDGDAVLKVDLEGHVLSYCFFVASDVDLEKIFGWVENVFLKPESDLKIEKIENEYVAKTGNLVFRYAVDEPIFGSFLEYRQQGFLIGIYPDRVILRKLVNGRNRLVAGARTETTRFAETVKKIGNFVVEMYKYLTF